jgi:hypothetical protein
VTPAARSDSAAVPTGRNAAIAAPKPISIPVGGDPSAIQIRETVKTVGVGDDAVELNSLSPEERARRRLKKNLILWTFGLIVIGITLAILLLIGPIQF